MKKPFSVNIAAIRGAPGSRQEIERSGVLDELAVSGSSVPDGAEVSFAGALESIEGPRIVAKGVVQAPWAGECRRCLGSASGLIEKQVREVFEPEPTEGETYPLTGDTIDLEPLMREAVVLDLPEVPLCREDCAGLCPDCGVNRNETQTAGNECDCASEAVDPRWAALDLLKEEPEG